MSQNYLVSDQKIFELSKKIEILEKIIEEKFESLPGSKVTASMQGGLNIDTLINSIDDLILTIGSSKSVKLIEKLRMLANILEDASDMIIGFDKELKLRYMNFSGKIVMNWEKDLDIEQKKLSDVFSERIIKLFKEKILLTCDRFNLWEGEASLKNQHEKEYPVFMSVNSHRDNKGNIKYYSAIIRNISIQKEIEMKLQSAIMEMSMLFNTTSNPMCIIENDFSIGKVNESFLNLFNCNYADVLTKKCYEMFGSDRCNTPRCSINLVQNGDSIKNYKEQYMVNGEKKIDCLITVNAFISAKGEIKGAIQDIKDITEIVKSEEEKSVMQKQLFQTAKLASIGELAGGVAHELNNPLAVIQSYNDQIEEILEEDNYKNEEVLSSIEGVTRSIKKMVKIINQLKAFGRKSTKEISSYDIHEIIDSALGLFGKQLGNKNIEVVKNFASEKILVVIDHGELEQVLVNLLLNARDAMEKSDQKLITITTKKDGDFLELLLEDTGPGIPGDIKEKIFDPFFTTKEVGKGTGLGLSISYDIIKKHSGTIEIENNKIGTGAVFKIRLPDKDFWLAASGEKR